MRQEEAADTGSEAGLLGKHEAGVHRDTGKKGNHYRLIKIRVNSTKSAYVSLKTNPGQVASPGLVGVNWGSSANVVRTFLKCINYFRFSLEC